MTPRVPLSSIFKKIYYLLINIFTIPNTHRILRPINTRKKKEKGKSKILVFMGTEIKKNLHFASNLDKGVYSLINHSNSRTTYILKKCIQNLKFIYFYNFRTLGERYFGF